MLNSTLNQKNKEISCFLLYKIRNKIPNIENYGMIYNLSDKFVLVKWTKRKYIKMYKNFLQPYPLPFTILSFIVLKALEKGYILENIVTSSPHVDYIIDNYLDEGEIEKLISYLQNNLDDLLAINQIVLRKGKKYVAFEIKGEICFINGKFPEDFKDLLEILASSLRTLVMDYIIME